MNVYTEHKIDTSTVCKVLINIIYYVFIGYIHKNKTNKKRKEKLTHDREGKSKMCFITGLLRVVN
jgi:hypothetical protein